MSTTPTPTPPLTPTLDKMAAQREELGVESIGNFLEWAQERGMVLARYREPVQAISCPGYVEHQKSGEHKGRYLCAYCGNTATSRVFFEHVIQREFEPGGHFPVGCTINDLMMEYVEVDPVEVEKEHRLLLDHMRALNAQ